MTERTEHPGGVSASLGARGEGHEGMPQAGTA
jgi:hypothetical protein